MKDVNKKLRQVYNTALSSGSHDCYYNQAPDGTTGNYFIFKTPSVISNAMKSGTSVSVKMTVVAITEGEQYNNGNSADDMADFIYLKVLPDPSHVLNLGADFDMSLTTVVSDTTQDWTLKDQLIGIDRTIIFNHEIFIR